MPIGRSMAETRLPVQWLRQASAWLFIFFLPFAAIGAGKGDGMQPFAVSGNTMFPRCFIVIPKNVPIENPSIANFIFFPLEREGRECSQHQTTSIHCRIQNVLPMQVLRAGYFRPTWLKSGPFGFLAHSPINFLRECGSSAGVHSSRNDVGVYAVFRFPSRTWTSGDIGSL